MSRSVFWPLFIRTLATSGRNSNGQYKDALSVLLVLFRSRLSFRTPLQPGGGKYFTTEGGDHLTELDRTNVTHSFWVLIVSETIVDNTDTECPFIIRISEVFYFSSNFV